MRGYETVQGGDDKDEAISQDTSPWIDWQLGP